MGFTNTRSLPYLLSYGDAHHYFINTKKPPRSKKWADYQRPLKNVSSTHYRIETTNDGEYYDIVLYHTVMARYYRPDADGVRRVLLRSHDSVTSKSFVGNVLGWWRRDHSMYTTTGDEVIVPLYTYCTVGDKNTPFSLEMYLDKDNRIDVSRSQHTPHYSHVSTDEDKQRRKEAREKLRNYVMLATMRLPEYIENATLEYSAGRPFGSGNSSYGMRHTWSRIVDAMLDGEVSEDELDAFFTEFAQEVFDNMASKRGYAQEGFELKRWYSARKNNTYADLEKPITPAEFEATLLNACLRYAGVDVKSGRKELPQFVKKGEYPRSNVHV